MGFSINEKITTELGYEDIALIAVALGMYQESIDDEECINHARRLVDKLGREMFNCKQ